MVVLTLSYLHDLCFFYFHCFEFSSLQNAQHTQSSTNQTRKPTPAFFFYNFKKVRIFQKSCNKPFHVSYKGNLYARMIFKIDHIPSSDGVRIYVHISDACLLPHIHTRNKVRSIICLRVKEEKKVTYNERSKATPITA